MLRVQMTGIMKIIVKMCQTCLKKNTYQIRQPTPGTAKKGNCPGDYRQIDFAELPHQNGYRYLLVVLG